MLISLQFEIAMKSFLFFDVFKLAEILINYEAKILKFKALFIEILQPLTYLIYYFV